MTGKCDNCDTMFDTHDGGAICETCGAALCPVCEKRCYACADAWVATRKLKVDPQSHGITLITVGDRPGHTVASMTLAGTAHVRKPQHHANAERVAQRIALCWNSHDELVAACKGLLRIAELDPGTPVYGVGGTVTQARAALAKAKGE